jgi:hypothetical protein
MSSVRLPLRLDLLLLVETGRLAEQLQLLLQVLPLLPQLQVLDGRLEMLLVNGVRHQPLTGVMPLLPSQLSNGKNKKFLWAICMDLSCSMVNLLALDEGKISTGVHSLHW